MAFRETALVRLSDVLLSFNKKHSCALRDVDSDPQIPQPELQSTEMCFQVIDEQ
jgi:hypothetical protein